MRGNQTRIMVCLILLVGGWLFSFSPLLEAKESEILWTQGRINPGGNLKSGYLLINEMKIYLDSFTKIMDHRGIEISSAGLKEKKWVYLEIEKGGGKNALKARKVYLLPHYVGPGQKKQFSFMK